ncbi:protein-L-isoaspartate(D-aspartate) O-methyltransferase [Phycisphaerales bacterium AB-hyl4]|uniref:Protein-L-isoaspartate O-methyltransferase n=1 Tax=Natronomicrosphaera hydrolytica TaxID=3242702 RepID=A0ABV4TZR4_9BACT
MGRAELAAKQMVQQQLRDRGIRDERVLAAMQRVPRHLFVPDVDIETAYSDHALPTAEGQTISQPYIVAYMTELLRIEPSVKVLEIGTGSGYQTAVLALLGAQVISVERHAGLADRARVALNQVLPGEMGAGVQVVVGDGTVGYPLASPYDRIIVTAAAPRVPGAYRKQLAEGGRLVLPVGDREKQVLTVVDRKKDEFVESQGLTCRFVPLVGEDAWGFGE